MKKKICVLGLCLITMTAMILTGCGDKSLYSGMDMSDYIKSCKYKGLETEKVEVKVTKEDIGNKIVEALKAAAEEKDLPKGDVVEDGDHVNIDYVGKIDGKKFEGGSAKNQDLELGSGSFSSGFEEGPVAQKDGELYFHSGGPFISGFEEGLVGHKVGEKGIVLNLAFPLDYNAEDLRGKDVEFTVKINGATRNVQPEYNDKFAQSQGKYKNTEEYEKAVKKSLKEEATQQAETNQKTKLWSQVVENTKVKKYPEEQVQHYIDAINDMFKAQAEQTGESKRMLMQETYQTSEKAELEKRVKQDAKNCVLQDMITEYIAEKENLECTDDEMDNYISLLEKQGVTEESVLKDTGKTMKQFACTALLGEKVMNLILKEAVIK